MVISSGASFAEGQQIHQDFQTALQQSHGRVVGHQDIYDLAQIKVMTALLHAYGDNPHMTLYAEPALLDAQIPPPDIVLIHPNIGLMVIECKAFDLDYIEGMEAGNLKIRRYGQTTLVNPLRQAQRGMFAIKDAYESLAYASPRPLFQSMVALPNITADSWEQQGYHRCIDSKVILFAEHFADTNLLRHQIQSLIDHVLKRTSRPSPYTTEIEPILSRVFGDSAVINAAREIIQTLEPDKLGAQIEALETAHKTLSAEQQYLSRLDTWGHPYLVRGVAGSGKSIVLANQVARTLYRHQKQHDQLTLFSEDRHPLPKIGVICFNRTLVPLLYERIQIAYRALTGRDLPTENIIINDLNQLLHSFQQQLGENHFRYLRAGSPRQAEGRAKHHRTQIEKLRLSHPELLEKILFDGVFVDEGQDSHPEEFMLINALIRPDKRSGERTLMIFYDDAQNVYGQPPPTWHSVGMNLAGGRATLMQQCYRNSREILELGLNVLLGTHAHQQTRIATRRFADIYTLQEKGLVEETLHGWRVHFAEATQRPPVVRDFASRAEQLDWIADAVVALIESESVAPEHILILAAKSTPFRHLSQRITQLARQKIPLRMVGGLYHEHLDSLLTTPGHLTLATIYAAKGYDAPIVFVVDADQIEYSVVGRALFYVGVTRAKRYLVVSGVNHEHTLLQEALAAQTALAT